MVVVNGRVLLVVLVEAVVTFGAGCVMEGFAVVAPVSGPSLEEWLVQLFQVSLFPMDAFISGHINTCDSSAKPRSCNGSN